MKPILERATFGFSQEANGLSHQDAAEFLTIECESSLGIDRDEGCFYVLKTEQWSINDEKDLKELLQAVFRHSLEIVEGKFEDDGREFGHLEATACDVMMICYQLKKYKK